METKQNKCIIMRDRIGENVTIENIDSEHV